MKVPIRALSLFLSIASMAYAAQAQQSHPMSMRAPPQGAYVPLPAPIPDDFNTANAIEPFDNGGSKQGKIADVSGDEVGAFRLTCPSNPYVKRDDPLVLPGQPGKAPHAHSSGGNSNFDAFQTYASLRASGDACGAPASIAAYRSSFWFPAMLDGAGNYVLPDYFNNYYKQLPNTDPDCKRRAKACVILPAGLSFVWGWNATTDRGGPMDQSSDDRWYLWFECWIDDNESLRVPGTGRTQNMDDLVKQGCGANRLLIAQINGPECWDGQNADSPDHRSHLAYPTVLLARPGRGQSPKACDGRHPYLIPQIAIREVYTTDANFAAGKWRFDCDMAGMPSGSCLHMDYKEAQSPVIRQTWWQHCINEHRSCSSGELGDGTEIKGITRLSNWKRHQLIPVE
jgi:hypothetical protein